MLLLICAAPLFHSRLQGAAWIDRWLAEDLSTLDEGDPVGSWASASNRVASAASNERPAYKKNVTPAAGPAVHFDGDRMAVADSPAGGLTAFSVALVFKADAAGANTSSQWYGKSGIVDAEEGGVTADWGIVINEAGRVGLGIGGADTTVYSQNTPSLVDTNYHVAVFTWGAGLQWVYVDNRAPNRLAGPTGKRNNTGLSLGGIHTAQTNQRFKGDVAEIRFYNSALTSNDVRGLISELTDTHLVANRPVIRSFTASTNEILIGSSVTLAWNVTNSTSILIDQGIGPVAGPEGSVTVSPRQNTTYTLTATNDTGPRSAHLTVLVDPGIPVAADQSLTTLRDQPLPVTLGGFDPNQEPLTYRVTAPPSHGSLSGTPPQLTYTPEVGFVGEDRLSFRVNDGGNDSPPGTISIRVKAPPTPPTELVLSSVEIDATAGPGAFIAALRTVDVNPEDTHSYALVSGFGNNAAFVVEQNRLLTAPGFFGGLGASFNVRLRTTDSTGFSLEQTFILKVVTREKRVVINEIHYDPADNTIREEFIELHNPSDAAVDVSLWKIRGGVSYDLPQGILLAPGGFLVIADNPATLLARYGVTAFGPWQGQLNNDGEALILRDANEQEVDLVDFRAEFPWPIAANGGGGSMELVNPSLDNNLGSSWRSSLTGAAPTPGATNRAYAVNAAPHIRQVHHTPDQPNSSQEVVITAKVTDPEGVASVRLHYQVVNPGAYLPSVLPVPVAQLITNPNRPQDPNPAFENATNWVTVDMVDDGTAGDAAAGDGVYTVALPQRANRTLVRYRITVTDTLGANRRAPFEDDPSLNFAYFVYNGLPAYEGVPASVLESLPVYFFLSRAVDIDQCTAYNSAYQIPQTDASGQATEARYVFNWPGTMVYEGRVYDHIRYRLRGANGRYQPGKRNFRIKFNDGRQFLARDQNGKLYSTPWKTLNTGKGSSNRETLTFGLNELLNYFLYNKVGVPSPLAHYFHFRVVDGAQEAPDKFNGDFWGLAWAQENYDVRFLESHDLPKGNVYKLINSKRIGYQQERYQAPFAVTNGFDHDNILNNLNGFKPLDWLVAHVYYPEWFHYHAICEAVRNYDFWPNADKNAAWYFEPVYTPANSYLGRMWTMPWDTDSTWGPTWNNGQDIVYNSIFPSSDGGGDPGQNPELQKQYRNVVREVRDLLIQPDQIQPLIDAFAAQIQDFIPADLTRWKGAPASGGSYSSLSAIGPAGNGLAPYVKDLKNFAFAGGSWPGGDVGAGGQSAHMDVVAADKAIPTRPVLTYVGPPGYPVDELVFESSAFADPQGNDTFAAMQWRVAEVTPAGVAITDPKLLKLEWDPVWESGELSPFTARIRIPIPEVQPLHSYRVRVRHQDNTGRWSRWSEPIQFIPTPADVLGGLQENLVLSELMYHPPNQGNVPSDDLEFVELQNIGGTALDLSGLFFSSGITFRFTNGTTLGAGQFFLLARNASALQDQHPGLAVNGVYTGKLDNGGETLTLEHPFGDIIFSVTYGDRAPWPAAADGFGFSLVLDDPAHGRYQASSQPGGSPGHTEPPSARPAVVINEVLTIADQPLEESIELHNPGGTSADIGGWYLTDDAAFPWKYRIAPGTSIPPGGFVKFTAAQFNPTPGLGTSFALSSLGEEVYLFSGDESFHLTGYSHGFAFGGGARNVSFGRYLNSVGDEQFPAQAIPSLGSANAGPRTGPVVINEVHYHANHPGEEFVELLNLSGAVVSLFDPAHPTNTWRLSGLGYTLPAGLTLAPNETALIIATNPAWFRAEFNLPDTVQVWGPADGALQDSGERLQLQRPESPTAEGVPYFTVDEVRYNDRWPWPSAADGAGASLQRIVSSAYGNDPINWKAAVPNPGSLSPAGEAPSWSSPPLPLTVVAYSDASFSAIATGPGPLFYQWRFRGERLEGQTNSSLVLTNVQRAQAGRYTVEAFNRFGSISNNNALLTVLIPALISSQPQSRTGRPGTNVTFSVTAASRTPISYQWRFDGRDLPGATSPTLVVTNAQPSQQGLYTVLLTDSVGGVLSAPARLTLLINPAIVRQPQTQEAVVGDTVTLGVVVAGTQPMGFRWRRNGLNYVLFGQGQPTLTFTNVQLTNSGLYSVTVTNQANPTGLASDTAALTVLTDTDGDHVPDVWETLHGMNPSDPSDAALDRDGDGLTDWQEYIAGTDPTNALSYLKVDAIRSGPSGTQIELSAISNKTYTVQFKESAGVGRWARLAEVTSQPSNRVERVLDPSPPNAQRFYRLVTPALPWDY